MFAKWASSLTAVMLLLPAGCMVSQARILDTFYASVQVGEALGEKLDIPGNCEVQKSKYLIEVRRAASTGECDTTGNESISLVIDLDGTVLAKSYSQTQVRSLPWLLWFSMRKRWECEIVSPLHPILKRTQPLLRDEQSWSGTEIARWVRTAESERKALPEGTKSLLQLLRLRPKEHEHVSSAAKRKSESELTGGTTVDGFALTVRAISDLLSSSPRNRLVRDLLNHVRQQGSFDGYDLQCKPLRKTKWFQVLGTTASHFRTTDKRTVVMTVEDSTHLSWVLFMLEGGWIMPLGVFD